MPRCLSPLLLVLLLLSVTTSWASGVKTIGQEQLLQQIDAGNAPVILDVRTPQEFAQGHVPGAINIPYNELPQHPSFLTDNRQKTVVVYCRSGRRAGIAEDYLQRAGFQQLQHLEGDMLGWEANQHPQNK